MDDNIDLKPCPFCGGDVKIIQNSWTLSYYIMCPNGHIFECYDFKDQNKLIFQWNRRVDQ